MSSGDPNQPRQPRDVKDLLRFCMEAGADEDRTTANHEAMSDERRQWLNDALSDMTTDHVASMRQHVDAVIDTTKPVDEREEALEELCSLCEHIDFAQDFHKIGAYPVIATLFTDPNPGLRSRVFELVATLVQNNEYCQLQALQCDWMPRIMSAMDDDPSDGVKVKAMYALSSLVRNNKVCQKQFTEKDGFSVVMRAMHTGVDKLKVKAAFLLTALTNEQPAYKETLCDIGMVDQLIGNLREDHSANHEHFMSALLAMVTDNERAVRECRRPELNLGHFLHERVKFLHGMEEYSQETSHAQSILAICFGDDDSGHDR